MAESEEKNKIKRFLNIFKNIKHKIFGIYGEQVFNVVTAIVSILACVTIAAPILLFLAPAVGCVLAISKLILDIVPPLEHNENEKKLSQKILQKAKKIVDTKGFQIATSILTALLLVTSFILTGGIAAIAVPLVVLGAGCIRAAIETKKDYDKVKEVLTLKDELQNLEKFAQIKAEIKAVTDEKGFTNLETKKELKPNIARKNNIIPTIISVLTALASCVCSVLILDLGGVVDNFKKIGDAVKQTESEGTLAEIHAEQSIKIKIQQLKKKLNMGSDESLEHAMMKIQTHQEYIKLFSPEKHEEFEKALQSIKESSVSRGFVDMLKISLDTEEERPTHKQTLEEAKKNNVSHNDTEQKKILGGQPQSPAESEVIITPEVISKPSATKGPNRDFSK